MSNVTLNRRPRHEETIPKPKNTPSLSFFPHSDFKEPSETPNDWHVGKSAPRSSHYPSFLTKGSPPKQLLKHSSGNSSSSISNKQEEDRSQSTSPHLETEKSDEDLLQFVIDDLHAIKHT